MAVTVPGRSGVPVVGVPFDASAMAFQTMIQDTAGGEVGDISVQRSGPSPQLEYTWTIAYTSKLGPIPLLVADASGRTCVVSSTPLLQISHW